MLLPALSTHRRKGRGFVPNFLVKASPTFILWGQPRGSAESAQALALKKDDRTHKEFEKWAVLTYSSNCAVINAKKGADKGIDTIAYFQGDQDTPEKIIFQVKSGNVKSGDIRDLQGTILSTRQKMYE